MIFQNACGIVNAAMKGGYAVPALNTNGGGYDIARAALEACEEMKSPLILQVYEPNCAYRGYDYFVKLADHLCDELGVTVPVVLQVDHGHSFESVVRAMKSGLTSVMFDASHDPLEENIAKTRKVVDVAKVLGVSVEAEVGYVKGNEPKKETLIGRITVQDEPTIPPTKTKIEEAVEFAKNVDIDMLAVSVGTTHGVYKAQTNIDLELLSKIRSSVDVPLVQHGTCGISLEDLSKLAKGGMNKINFGEPFRFNFIRYFNELTDEMEHLWHPWKIMQETKNRIKADMKELIIALGSEGKA
jgi:fructose-bisphosphate aldolase class II/tagatose 1,6-diphosphate aldolase GatY/KbaY